jgi:CheY-like chemotaxis protein
MATQRRILLVEDSKDLRFLMKTELEWSGYTVDAAADAYEGLNLARTNRPDLIISDIQMPGLDGFEFVRRIRQTPNLAGVPAIALTGFDFSKDEKKPVGGFSAHVTKPVDTAELVALIRQLTGRKRHAA